MYKMGPLLGLLAIRRPKRPRRTSNKVAARVAERVAVAVRMTVAVPRKRKVAVVVRRVGLALQYLLF